MNGRECLRGVDACVTQAYSDEELEMKAPGLKIEGEGEGKLLIAGRCQDEVFDEWLGGKNNLSRTSGPSQGNTSVAAQSQSHIVSASRYYGMKVYRCY